MRVGLLVLLFAVAYLGLKSLGSDAATGAGGFLHGGPAFWDDEAQVALMARNLVTTGTLTGWDGRTLYGYRNGGALDAGLRPVNPPLDIFLCAASFRLTGQTTDLVARLPFVLVGIATLVLFARLVFREFPGQDFRVFVLLMVALSPAFLLYIRQCRYFSLVMLAAVAAFYQYRRFCSDGRPSSVLFWAGSLAIAFYASPLACAMLLGGFAAHAALLERARLRESWSSMAAALSLFAVLTAPYAIYYRIWDRHDHLLPAQPWGERLWRIIWWNLRDLNASTVLPWVAAVIAAFYAWRFRRRDAEARVVAGWAAFILGQMTVLFLLTPQRTDVWHLPAAVRYHVGFVPFALGLAGAGFAALFRYRPWLGSLALTLALTTDVLTLTPGRSTPRLLLPAFLQEIHSPYPTGTEGVAAFLRRAAAPEATVGVQLDYMAYPVIYYAGDHVRLSHLLDKSTHLPETATGGFPSYVWTTHFPDWFVGFGILGIQEVHRISTLAHRSGVGRYELVEVLPLHREQTQRPELAPGHHNFGPLPVTSPQEAIGIFRLKPSREAAITKALRGTISTPGLGRSI